MSDAAPNIPRLKRIRALCIAVVVIYLVGSLGISLAYSGDNASRRETAQTPVCVKLSSPASGERCYATLPGYFKKYGLFVMLPFALGIGITNIRIKKHTGE